MYQFRHAIWLQIKWTKVSTLCQRDDKTLRKNSYISVSYILYLYIVHQRFHYHWSKAWFKYKYFMVTCRALFAIMSNPMVVLFEEKVIFPVLFEEVASLGMYLFDVKTTGIVWTSFLIGRRCHKIFLRLYFYNNFASEKLL